MSQIRMWGLGREQMIEMLLSLLEATSADVNKNMLLVCNIL
jgi:hypothetical protein